MSRPPRRSVVAASVHWLVDGLKLAAHVRRCLRARSVFFTLRVEQPGTYAVELDLGIDPRAQVYRVGR